MRACLRALKQQDHLVVHDAHVLPEQVEALADPQEPRVAEQGQQPGRSLARQEAEARHGQRELAEHGRRLVRGPLLGPACDHAPRDL
eukprot:10788634-Lingulodinium_polyedra.AAC.1